MPSTFSWLDYSETDRAQMQQLINTFREQDTRDELGLSAIRDGFADLFFPGTGTVQTRARYFLIVPWQCLELERKRVDSQRFAEKLKWAELKLITELLENTDGSGVIGRLAGQRLQRRPSSIYWNGLGALGIRHFQGSIDQYFASLDAYYRRNRRQLRADDGEPIEMTVSENWHEGMPQAPEEFPDGVDLELLENEAEYLHDRIVETQTGSVLAFLVDRGQIVEEAAYVWEHPQLSEFPATAIPQIEHARLFSLIMNGAALLYNLMLNEIRRSDDDIARFRERLSSWSDDVEAERFKLASWDITAIWRLLSGRRVNVTPRTRQFCEKWTELVKSSGPREVIGVDAARELIKSRERALKGPRARFVNQPALEKWSGNSGTAPLNYRWPSARIIINDIRRGLGGEDYA